MVDNFRSNAEVERKMNHGVESFSEKLERRNDVDGARILLSGLICNSNAC